MQTDITQSPDWKRYWKNSNVVSEEGVALLFEKIALSRETELRRKIADELDVIDNEAGDNPEKHDEFLTLYIEKLRGNK